MNSVLALNFAVLCMGISAATAQLLFMRELLCVFGGNEMVLGVVLGSWLLLGGLGAALGRWTGRLRRPAVWVAGGLAALGVLPLATILAVRALSAVAFVRGAGVGLDQTIGACFVVLTPYCLLAGCLLTSACAAMAGEKGERALAGVYMLDSVGMIAAGLVLTFLVFGAAGHVSIALWCGLLTTAAAVWLGAACRSRAIVIVAAVAAASLVAVMCGVDVERVSTRMQHEGFDVAGTSDTLYGRLVLTRSGGQVNFIYSGVPLASTGNPEAAEETAHYAMAQRTGAQRVLLAGAAAMGAWPEIRKYGRVDIDILETDAALADAVARHVGLPAEGVRIICADARSYLRQVRQPYDVVIVGAHEPDTAAGNRYFTREFFATARQALGAGGVLCFTMGSFENTMPRELADAIATAHATLKSVFRNVLVLPAGRVVFLASDGELTADIAGRLAAAGIATQFVTPSYLSGMFSPARMGEVARAVRRGSAVNTDMSPVLYLRNLRLWMRRYDVRVGAVEALALAAMCAYVLQLRGAAAGVFTAGLAGSALEVVLLLGFQSVYGGVYQKAGLLVSMFMAGLAAGAFVAGRFVQVWDLRHLRAMELAMAFLAAATGPAIVAVRGFHGMPLALVGQTLYGILAAAPGLVIGMQVPLAGRLSGGSAAAAAARVFTADFVGACLGAILVGAVLIPLLGVPGVCLLLAGCKLASLAATFGR